MARGRKPVTGGKAMTAAQRQRRRRALKQFSETRRYAEDPRREGSVSIAWSGDNLIGRIGINGEYWAAVEWSEKHHCWCIEDSTGACLAHQEAIQGAAGSKDAAVALATEMIRDRRMPSPQEAKEEARQRRWARLTEEERALEEARAADADRRRLAREKRAQQPSEQRRRADAEQRREKDREAWDAEWKATWREDTEQPLYEMLNEVFDFADPALWKSNSFAALRPRLIIHLEAVVARLDRHVTTRAFRAKAEEPRLTKAREILELLRAA